MSDPKRWSARSPIILGVVTIGLLFGGFGGWAATAKITGAVIAGGQIEVDQNRQVVQHPDGGVVTEILVTEGDTVREGDLLIRLDPETLQSDLSVVEGQLFEMLARRARYEAERDGATELKFDPILTELNSPVVAELMDGQARLFAARNESASLVGTAGELAASVAQAEGRITELDLQILGIDTTRREEAITTLRDLQYNELELRERRRALVTRLDRLDIRAPVSGIVYGLQVFAQRSVIRPADPVLYLVPQDRPLVIATQIQTRDIDQVFIGQQVALRFSAFDQRRTPELFGHVTKVSADAFQDQNTRVSFYRAEIKLDDGESARLPTGMTLIPGMPVEAFIRTEERSPLDYFLKPVADFFAKAFRES